MARNPIAIFSVLALLVLAGSIWLLSSLVKKDKAGSAGDLPVITLHCAAGLAKPVQRIADQYQAETGRRVNLQFGGSGTLLSGLQVSKQGDLFLAADDSYIKEALSKKLIAEVIPIASLIPVIGVKSGNPKNVKGLADLAREDLRVAMGDPEAAAIGSTSRMLLEEKGLWSSVSEAVQSRGVYQATVNGLATDVSSGPIDATLLWSAVASQFERIETIAVDYDERHCGKVSLGLLTASTATAEALHFARYLAAKDKGMVIFREEGLDTVEGDTWADTPELTIFSGGVNRVAIEETIREFQEREGVRVNTVYNGCGILVSQMRAGAKPDAYLACDTSYMEDVFSRFRDHRLVSSTDMVIIAAPGNPKQITSLADLSGEGVRLAITNPDYSALGGLTHRLLRETNLFDPVIANVTFGDAPTADAVVTRVRTGREDAGIVYRANTIGLNGALEIIEIEHPAATASQPVGVSVETPYPHLMDRLVEALANERSGNRYQNAGFEFIFGKEWPKS